MIFSVPDQQYTIAREKDVLGRGVLYIFNMLYKLICLPGCGRGHDLPNLERSGDRNVKHLLFLVLLGSAFSPVEVIEAVQVIGTCSLNMNIVITIVFIN